MSNRILAISAILRDIPSTIWYVLYDIRQYCIFHLVRGHPRLGSSTVPATAVDAPAGPTTRAATATREFASTISLSSHTKLKGGKCGGNWGQSGTVVIRHRPTMMTTRKLGRMQRHRRPTPRTGVGNVVVIFVAVPPTLTCSRCLGANV